MKRIEIEVLSGNDALAGFAKAWKQIERRRAQTPRMAFGSLAELFSAITEKRLELIRHVATHGAVNVRQLAASLGRDYKNVHTDVRELVDLGLLDKDASGHLSAPFDEPVIRAGLRDVA